MNKQLFFRAVTKFLGGFLMLALLVFLPAWTLRYWQGWLLLAILFVPMLVVGAVLMKRSPALLEKRLNARRNKANKRRCSRSAG